MAKKNAVPESLSETIIRRWGRRKLAPLSKAEKKAITAINADYLAAAKQASDAAHAPDTKWLISLWCSPRDLGKRTGPNLPDLDLVLQAINVIENKYTGKSRTLPRKKIRIPLKRMWEAHAARMSDERWTKLSGSRWFSQDELQDWYDTLEAEARNLTVLPNLERPSSFNQAVSWIEAWDGFLRHRGHTGERFSLQEELTRLHNWPGDQWNTGDDYASAQERYHRRLYKARQRKVDPLRDQVLRRALYLREGLLTTPIEPLEWFLAAASYTTHNPRVMLPWTRKDLNMLGDVLDEFETFSLRRKNRPFHAKVSDLKIKLTEVDEDELRWVSGPAQMIDLDEDVVAALPPGCQVKRLIVSRDHPIGPDWMIYWVESEDGGARPILDLVETAKLRPPILFVSDGQPANLASLVEDHLHRAYTIPTHPLSAWAGMESHGPDTNPFT
ncbi:MAG: hypothetical protein Q4D87_08385 [Actinomycetaceae bacterium]|nr:hypothetical protein [Actinomycetaceae bacterium]